MVDFMQSYVAFLYSNFIFNISILLLFIKKIKYFYFLSFVFCYNSVKKDYEMTPTVMLKFYLKSIDCTKKLKILYINSLFNLIL